MKNEKLIQISAYSETCVDSYILSDKQSCYWLFRTIERSKEPFVEVYKSKGKWCIRENNTYHLLSKENKYLEIKKVNYIQSASSLVLLYMEELEKSTFISQKIPDKKSFLLGRDDACDICINHPFVSKIHIRFEKQEQDLYLFDEESKNGVYVNNKRVKEKKLQDGDSIQIPGIQMLYVHSYFFISENIDTFIHMKKKEHQYVQRKGIPGFPAVIYTKEKIKPVFAEREIPLELIHISTKEEMPFWYTLGPSFTMGSASLLSAVFMLQQAISQKSSLQQIIPSVTMAVSMMLTTMFWPLISKYYEKIRFNKQYNSLLNDYRRYLKVKNNEVYKYIQEKQCYERNKIEDFITVKKYIETRSPYLWNRKKENDDFLYLHCGWKLKKIKAPISDKQEVFDLQKNEVKEEYLKFVNSSYEIKYPFLVDLKKYTIGVYGEKALYYGNMFILYIAALHSKKDVTILLVGEQEYLWKSKAKWISQVEENNIRHVYSDEKDIQKLLVYLKQKRSENRFYIIVLLNISKKLTQQILNSVYLMKNVKYIQCCKEKEMLSDSVDFIFSTEDKNVFYKENKKQENILFEVEKKESIENLFRKLMLLQEFEEDKKDIYESFGVLSLYSCTCLNQLNILERWKESQSEDSLRVPIGIDEFNEYIWLDAHENAHGPHGLFAGTTGSGKSECILTYILSLSIQFSYEDVCFVIIDYKGGMMANALQGLPHVSCIMTNLCEDERRRMHLSLQSEVNRRQQIFANDSLGSMDIYKYQKLVHEQKRKKPIPHMFIVIDEFAQLKQQYPDFLDFLKQIARIGRSLGIHLLLATQKPFGVVDEEIWSNSHFHLCLKVQDRQDSMDMLKNDDAVYLKNPGEFYLQVGNNEVYVKGKSAWTQQPYIDEKTKNDKEDKVLRIFNQQKELLKEVKPKTYREHTELQMIVFYLKKIAKGKCAKQLFFPNLKPDLERIKSSLQNCWNMGMVDDISKQSQYPWILDISQFHHLLLIDSKEKASFLNVFLQENENLYQDNPVYVYILAVHPGSKESLLQYPSVQEAISVEESEKIKHFLSYLKNRIRKRKKNAEEKNDIVIVLQEFEYFKETFPELMEDILFLLREGEKTNIHFFVFGSDLQMIPYLLFPYFDLRIIGELREESSYITLLGNENLERPLHQKGSYVCDDSRQVKIVQLHKEIRASYKKHKKPWALPSISKVIPFPKTRKGYLFIGIDKQSMEEYQVSFEKEKFIVFLTNTTFLNGFVKGIKRQLQDHCAAYIENKKETKSSFCIWDKENVSLLLDNEEGAISLLEQNDVNHVFFLDMSCYQQMKELDVFMDRMEEGLMVWVGRGLADASYMLGMQGIAYEEKRRNAVILNRKYTLLQIAQEIDI
ncbi:FtsK/SpoIIIE domain-containing protein [Amedibacterium intestinale]|uniref:FtsK/SpoIIIE domain-containing protein n=1 Tax=Amedibacterium intestinale TaxID=2583452 RepID=UPI00130058D8